MNFTDSPVSPFYNYIFQDDNKNTFKNIYQYYLYKKFNILITETDKKMLLQMSNNRRDPIVSNWDTNKYKIMLDGYILAIKNNTGIKSSLIRQGVYTDTVPIELSFWKIKFNLLLQEILYLINMNRIEFSDSKTSVQPVIRTVTRPTKHIFKQYAKLIFSDDDNILCI